MKTRGSRSRGEQDSGTSQVKTDVSIQSGDLVLVLDHDGRIVEANTEAVDTFGYTAEQLNGVPIEVLCPRLQYGPTKFDINAIESGRDFVGGFECARQNGTSLSLYMYATVNRSRKDHREENRVSGVVCVAREVTDFWQAEEAVRVSREKYRLLFDLSPDLVLLTTTDGRIAEANQMTCRLLGYTAERLRRMSVMDFVPSDSRRTAELVFSGLWRRRQLKSVLDFQTPDGNTVKVEFNASVSRVDGKPMVLAIGRDITDRVQVERNAEEASRKYELMFSAIGDAVFLETLEGRILDANRAACDQLGYNREELLGMTAADLMPEEARSWLPNIREAVLREGDFTIEGSNVRKDGTEFPTEVRCSRLELDGQTLVLVMTRDITERKESELAVRRSEEKLRALYNNVPVGIFRTTPGGRFLSVNPAAVKMMGYSSEEEMLAVPVSSAYAYPEYRQKVVEKIRQDGRLVGFEIEMRRKDGTTFPAVFNASIVASENSEVFCIDGAMEDIAFRRQVEQKLQQERDLAQRYLDIAGTIIVALDAGGVVTLANKAACRVLGWRDHELVGRSWFDTCVPSGQREEVRAVHKRLMSGDVVPLRSYRNPVVTRTGELRTVEWTNTLLTDEAGRINGTLSSGNDVSDKLMSEQALRDSEEKHRDVVERAKDGIAVVVDGRLVFVNPALVKMAGYPEAELIGASIADFMPDEFRAALVDMYARRRSGENTQVPCQTLFRHSDGHLVDIEVTASTVSFDGRRAELVFIRDITERKEAARQLSENHRALETLMSNLPGMAYRCRNDRKWTMEFVSRGAADLTGYRPEELVDNKRRAYADLIHPLDRELVWKEVQVSVRERESFELVYRIETASGDTKWVQEQGRGVFDEDGRLEALEGFIADVTERKAAEEEARKTLRALRESKQRYRQLFEKSPHGVAVYQKGKVVLANRAMAQMLGYDTEREVTGMPVGDYIHPDDRQTADERQQVLFATGERGPDSGKAIMPLHVRFVARDGSYVPVEVAGSLVEWGAEPAVQVIVRPGKPD